MANNYTQFSESIGELTQDEQKWIRDALNHGGIVFQRFVDQLTKEEDESAETFPEFDWSIGPHSKWDEGRGRYEDTKLGELWLRSADSCDLNHVALFVQAFLTTWRPRTFFSLTWADTCDKLRVGEFSGGAVFITAERAELHSVGEWVQQKKEAFEKEHANG